MVDDDSLGVEASENHVTAESPPGARGSTNSNNSVIDYPAVSSSRSPQTRRDAFATHAVPPPSASDAATVCLPPAVAALLRSPDHAIPTSATPRCLQKRLTVADTGATEHMFHQFVFPANEKSANETKTRRQ